MYKDGRWLATGDATFVPMCPTLKSLEDDSNAPFQDEYPVWYFLTGELARPGNLRDLLKLDSMPKMRRATVRGLKEITGVNGSLLVEPSSENTETDQNTCNGWAYRVQTEAEETAMRFFKTNIFGIHRCKISFSERDTDGTRPEVEGLVFVYKPGVTWVDQEMSDTCIKAIETAREKRSPENPPKCATSAVAVPQKTAPSPGPSADESRASSSRSALTTTNHPALEIGSNQREKNVARKASGDLGNTSPAKTHSARMIALPQAEGHGFAVVSSRDGNPSPRTGYRRPSSQEIRQARVAEQARMNRGAAGEDDNRGSYQDGGSEDEELKIAQHYQALQEKLDAQKSRHDREDRDARAARALQAELNRDSCLDGSWDTKQHRSNLGKLGRSEDETPLEHPEEEQADPVQTDMGKEKPTGRSAILYQALDFLLIPIVRFFIGFLSIADTPRDAGPPSALEDRSGPAHHAGKTKTAATCAALLPTAEDKTEEDAESTCFSPRLLVGPGCSTDSETQSSGSSFLVVQRRVSCSDVFGALQEDGQWSLRFLLPDRRRRWSV